jgi:nucleoside-diphosphate-sugar epimerase
MATRAIIVTGATGKQGGSVVNALLKANAPYEILALTRDAHSASSKKLLQKSPRIKLVSGNLNATDEVFKKAKEATKTPIWGVFSVQVRNIHITHQPDD